MKHKRILGTIILLGYFFSSFLSWLGYLPFDSVYAASDDSLTPLVAILVEKNLYPKISSDLQRYGASYLSKQYPGSDSIIFQIDTSRYHAIEITQMLENIYFDGLKEEGSRLIGVVLVGEIPLPIINHQGYLFPSIYPYVDFLDQKYLYDPVSQYFVPNNYQDGQAELWHGIINFDGVDKYQNYFQKLKKYDQNPETFVGKNLRYEDFVALKDSFLAEKFSSYLNKQIFAEDLMYNRYHQALLNYLKSSEEGKNLDLLQSLADDLRESDQEDQAKEIESSIKDAENFGSEKVATLFLKESIDNFLANYLDTLSTTFLTTIKENVKTSDRWKNYDSHISKLSLIDQAFAGGNGSMGLIMNLNDTLEQYIDQKVAQENYAMNVVIPIAFSKNKSERIKRLGVGLGYAKTVDDMFRFYYFGKDALRALSPLDFSIYRGTYRNISEIRGKYSDIINDRNNPAKSTQDTTDLSQKGIGASYDLFSTQIEANRGYDVLSTQEEYDLYQIEKTYKEDNITRKCKKRVLLVGPCKERKVTYKGSCDPTSDKEKDQKDCESFQEFSQRNRGGASALNLDQNALALGKYVLSGFDYQSAWRSIFGIAGSQQVPRVEPEATSYLAKDKYISPTLIKSVDEDENKKRYTAGEYPIFHDMSEDIDFFQVVNATGYEFHPMGKGIFEIKKPKTSKGDVEYIYYYKTLESVIKHDSVTSQQVNGYTGAKYSETSVLFPYYHQIRMMLDSFEGKGLSVETGVNNTNLAIDLLDDIAEKIKNKTRTGDTVTENIQEMTDLTKDISEDIENIGSLIAQDIGAGVETLLNNLNKTIPLSERTKKFPNPFGISIFQTRFSEINEDFTSALGDVNNFYGQSLTFINKLKNDSLISKSQEIEGYIIAQQMAASGAANILFWNQIYDNFSQIELDVTNLYEESLYESVVCALIPGDCTLGADGEQLEAVDLRKSLQEAKQLFITLLVPEADNPEIFFPGMSISTSDRPIDSPRYLSFQGVGASEVKLIYPNFFKVEVYSSATLKTPAEIATAIKDYLRIKVNEYNKFLIEQKNAVETLIREPAYQKLATSDLLATPTLNASVRSYALFEYEEMVKILGGDQMINTLAWMIYIQNISNSKRTISDSILDDLKDIQTHYDINEKIGTIIDYYLVEQSDDFFESQINAHPDLVIPNYKSEGYEVGFINTDGNDFIEIQNIDGEKGDLGNNAQGTMITPDPYLPTIYEESNECNFDYNEPLQVYDIESASSPRIDGLNCRWDSIKDRWHDPDKLSISRDNVSLDAGIADFLGIKNTDGLLDTSKNTIADWLQKFENLSSDSEVSENLSEIIGAVQIGFDKQTISVESPTGAISFGSIKDFGDIPIRIFSTGDNCLKIGEINTCNSSASFTINPFKGTTIPFKLMNNVAGTIYVVVDFCDTISCYSKQLILYTVPAKPSKFSLNFPHTEGLLAGAFIPITLNVFDKFDNPIQRDVDEYLLSVDKGNLFLASHVSSGIKINDFKTDKLGFYIDYGSIGLVQFKITDRYGTGINGAPPVVNTMKLINGTLKITEQATLKQSLEPLIVVSGEGNAFLNRKLLKEVEVKLVDSMGIPLPLDINVLLSPEKGVVQPYEIVAYSSTNTVREGLKALKRLSLKQGQGKFVVTAGKNSGSETIRASIAGIPEAKLQLKIEGLPIIEEEQIENKEKFFLSNVINSGLNIMYLNLFGSDWGNQWGYFSDNKKFSEKIINQSSRTLSITTQLIDPKKVMKTLLIVHGNGTIENNNQIPVSARIDRSGMILNFSNYGQIKISKFNPEINIYLAKNNIEEQILAKSITKDNPTLVIYNPKEAIEYREGALWHQNGEMLRSKSQGSDLRLTDDTLGTYNVWNLYYKDKNIADVLLLNVEVTPTSVTKKEIDTRYSIASTFDKGSSHYKGAIGLFAKGDTLENFFQNYNSIENADKQSEYLGFRGDFKNISLFGEGQSVGESTVPFGSEFLINIGDPGVKRVDKNYPIKALDEKGETIESLYHGGLGKVIYNTTSKNIFKVQDIDYNNDGLKDLLVVYDDGVIDLLKQYQNNEFVPLNTLMLTSESIEKIFVGDVDGNGYEDIIIKNSKNQLRAYTNNKGVFDVDGYPICLNVARTEGENEMSVFGVQQMFWEDMDGDGAIDIVAVDREGHLKVFYGGTKKGGGTYVSKDKYKCDPDRQSRQIEELIDTITVVKTSDFLRSMQEHESMINETEISLEEEELPISLEIPSFGNDLGNKKVKIKDLLKQLTNVDYTKTAKELIDFYSTSSVPEEPKNSPDLPSSIVFPDRVYLEDVHGPDFAPEYSLQTARNGFLDINIVSEDGCNKVVKTYFNSGKSRQFIKDSADLQILADLEAAIYQAEIDSSNSDLEKEIDEMQESSDPAKIPFLSLVKESFNISFLDGENLVNFENAVITFDEVEKKIQNVVDGLCNGFSFGKNYTACQGLPVPFNQAFLAPGNYHIMGCIPLAPLTNTIGKGVPIFSVPTLGPVNVAGVPVPPFWPRNFNGAGGIFGGTSSQFRIYIAPTLTAQIGVAFCFGPYGVASKIKGFIGEMGGNCIVTSFPLPCSQKEKDLEPTYKSWTKTYGDTKVCNSMSPSPDLLIPETEEELEGSILLDNLSLTKTIVNKILLEDPETEKIAAIQELLKSVDIALEELSDGEITQKGPELEKLYKSLILVVQDNSFLIWLENLGTTFQSLIVSKIKEIFKSLDKLISNPAKSYLPSLEGNDAILWGGGSFGGDSFGLGLSIDGVKIDGSSIASNKLVGGLKKGIQKKIVDRVEKQAEYLKYNLLRFSVKIILPDLDPIKNNLSQLTNVLGNDASGDTSIPSLGDLLKDNLLNPYKKTSESAREGYLKPGAQSAWSDILTPWKKNTGKDAVKTVVGSEKIDSELLQNIETFSQAESAFDTLFKSLNATDMVSLTTKNVNVKVPRIYPEDIEAYANYLRIWMETNGKILEEWGALIASVISLCDTDPTNWPPERKEQCASIQKTQAKYLEMSSEFKKLGDQIFQNIEVLEKYKRFPLEIYEWMHVSEKYVSEVSGMIAQTFGYFNHRFNLLSLRISQWIDAIISISAIVKSYQVMIDLFVNRSAKCGKCKIDTYDQYSCKFSALLPDIPLLPIPKVKIPNIILDFSHINFGIDIVLPQFNFIPEHIDLPRLPNFPIPPAVIYDISFNVPDIPILPDPPILPELPSFIPTINFQLPNLPPAPKIPELPNKISGIINVLQKLSKIYCIIKSGIGLVAEPAVKSRIEQMTQRSYVVPWVDELNLTNLFKPTVLQGLDYQLDTYVDIEYNFDGFYNFLNTTANTLNNRTYQNILSSSYERSNQMSQKMQGGMDDLQEEIGDGTININLEKDLSDFFSTTLSGSGWLDINTSSKQNDDLDAPKEKRLAQLIEAQTLLSSSEKKSIDPLIQLLQKDSKITVNTQEVEQIQDTVAQHLLSYQENLTSLLDLVQDYPRFLSSIEQFNDEQAPIQLAFTAPIFNKPQGWESLFSLENNPYLYLVNSKQSTVDYLLSQNDPDTIKFSDSSSDQQKILVDMKKFLDDYQSILVKHYPGTDFLNTIDGQVLQKPLFSQAKGSTLSATTQSTNDFSQYVDGVIIDTIDTVNSAYNAKKLIGYYQVDLNNDNKMDFIAWDNNNVYYKVANDNQNSRGIGGSVNVITPLLDQKNAADHQYTTLQRSFLGANTSIKTLDTFREVKNFKVIGQTFDALSFSRKNNLYDANGGFLLRFAENISSSYEKSEKNYKYVLVIPNGQTTTNRQILLDGKKKKIENIVGSEMYEIHYYNPSNQIITISLSEIPRRWQYAQIAVLSLENNIYKVESPRSNQIVAGRQITADNRPPEPKISLLRNKKSQIVSEGSYLEGYVGTYYDLQIDRVDNVEISEVAIAKEGQILEQKSLNAPTGSIKLQNLFYTGTVNDKYTIRAKDSEGNLVTETITLHIENPEIQITGMEQYSGWKEGLENPIKVTAEWDMDIDKGDVTFQRVRNGILEDIVGILDGEEKTTDAIGIDQNKVSRERIDYGNKIGLYDTARNLMAQLDPNTGEITITPNFLEKISIEVDFSKGFASTKIIDIATKKILFSIFLQPEILGTIDVYKGELINLNSPAYGIYDGGHAFLVDGEVVLYISNSGYLGTINRALRGSYQYDKSKQEVVIKIYEHSFGSPLLQVSFKTKPYLY